MDSLDEGDKPKASKTAVIPVVPNRRKKVE
jgi:hypothetical protein